MLTAKDFRMKTLLGLFGLLCLGLPQALSQWCEPQAGRRVSFECHELSSLQQLKSLSSLSLRNVQSLKIRNGHTDLSIDTAGREVNLIGLLQLDVAGVRELRVEELGFVGLPQLKQLNISGCGLAQLLDTDFAANSPLQQLDASHNDLSTLTKDLFENLRTLVSANFSHNALPQIELPHMPLLQQLQLQHNQLSRLSLGHCPRLQRLDLSDNQLSQLNESSFRGASALLDLRISLNGLRTIGRDTFEPLAQLRFLNLSHNELDAVRPQVFGSEENQSIALQLLDLSSNNIRLLFDNQFRALGKLQVLDLSHNSLASLSPAHFEGLGSLRRLFLQSNDIIEIKQHTFANLEDLETLDLSQNNIESLGEQAFGSQTLTRLRKLNLNGNNLKRLHPLSFSSLPFVEYLSLGNNQLSQLDVRMFAPMRHLEKLHLGNNELTEISDVVLDSLSSVVELLIDNNKLTSLPNLNGTLTNLKRVAIEGNPWQCPCFKKLENWLLANRVVYLRKGTGFFSGEKPLCLVTKSENCVDSLEEAEHQDVVEEFEDLLKGGRLSDGGIDERL